jgi:magnesium-protoporphyrin IX monomethyl ester (oxidative) cyclase
LENLKKDWLTINNAVKTSDEGFRLADKTIKKEKQMHIYLVNPPRIHPKSWGRPNVSQPLEIAYVAAVLEKQHKVRILDAPGEDWRNIRELDETRYRVGLENEEIAYKIKSWSPDVVGINIPFSGWSKTGFEVASIVKSIDKDIITVLDGVHPSARPLECLTNPAIDFVVIGEAESTWLELANALEQGVTWETLKKVRGIGFNKNGDKVITSPRPFIEDLDSLPFPARHLLPMENYFAAVKENPLRGEVSKPWTMMITSRGCPHSCIFCSAHIVKGRKWRGRSPENVLDEIEHVINNYHVKQIDFHDDNLTLNKKRMKKICDLIIKKKLKIEWFTPNGIRADTLDENLLMKMKKSGCKRIYIAPESGVQRVVDQIIKKNLDLKSVEKAVTLARKVGIKVACFFIIGLIGETKQDIKATIEFAHRLRKLGADKFYFSYATPLYGTELFEKAKQGGHLKEGFSDEDLSTVEPLIETSEFTIEDLRKLCAQANLVNPIFTINHLKKALREPEKALKVLFEKVKSRRKQHALKI